MSKLRQSLGRIAVLVPTFLVLLPFSADVAGAEVVITTSTERIDWSVRPEPAGPRLAPEDFPTDGEIFFPWIYDDTQGSLGPITVYSIRNEGVDFVPVDVEIEFYDESFQLITSELNTTIQANQSFPRNLREKRELIDNNRVARGIARVVPDGPITVDVFEIDSANDYASGGPALTLDDFCTFWTARFLRFAPSLESTQLFFLINGPLGAPAPPTIEGEVFTESGDFVQSFVIETTQSLVVVDAFLLTGGLDFGSMEIRINTNPADGGGTVSVLHRAFNRFSVGHQAACTDDFQPPTTLAD